MLLIGCRRRISIGVIWLWRMEDVEHSDVIFTTFLNGFGSEVCPVCGEVSYLDGHIDCSVHSDSGEKNEKEDSGGG
jgi:hypothetical protein